MPRILTLIATLLLILAACQPAAPDLPPPDPIALVTEAAAKIRETENFRMIVEQTGAPFYILTDLGNVVFRRADAQYVAPDLMQADVRLLVIGGVPAEVEVFSKGLDQYYRNQVLTANQWVNAPFAPGFNPQALIAEETGFQAALTAMIDLTYVGGVTLETGASAHHLRAQAQGDSVSALLAGLVPSLGETVVVDIYIDQASGYPARFVIVQPGTETADEPEPTTWTVDILDINGSPELDPPSNLDLPAVGSGS